MRQSKNTRGVAALSALSLLALVSGCGGGSEILGGEPVVPGQTISIVGSPPTVMNVRGGAVVRLEASAVSSTKGIASMKWTVTPITPGTPSMTLTDANCASAQRNDIGGSISSSAWTCKTSTVVPAMAKDAMYQVLITATDSGGASATRMSQISAAAVPPAELAALRPVVVTSPKVTVTAGTEAGLTCAGAPGANAIDDVLYYSWRVKSNPNGLSLALTDDDKPTVRFAAPAVLVGYPKRATFECKVTDSQNNFAVAEIEVTIATEADSVPRPTVIGSSSKVQLYTNVESQLSCIGTGGYVAQDGDGLRYRWVVKTNESGVVMNMTGDDQPTVRIKPGEMPASVTTPTTPVVLQCRVTDDANRTTTVDIPAEVNRAEATTSSNTVIADAGTSKNVGIGEIVVLDGTASKMVGAGTGVQLYYSWRQVGGTTVSLSGANTASPSFRSPNQTSVTTLRFELTVSAKPITADYVAKPTEVAFVDITVGSAAAPRISLPSVATVAGGVSHTITALVADNPESLPVYFRWTQVSGTAVVIQTPNLSTISFFTPNPDGPFEDLVFNVEASFDPVFPAGATASQDAIVRVNGS